MSERNESRDLPELTQESARPSFWQRLSVVWLVPVLALAVSLGVAWKSFSERGALIEIAFPDAAGVVAGQTEVKYRDVAIGRVEKVAFSDDLSEVIVSARVEKDLMAYLDEDARFWVVRPEVSVRGITGLDTVLSGVFIEGSWDTNAGEARTRFVARSGAPLSRPGQPGRHVIFRMRDGNQLAAGAPVLYKGIEVGHIETPRLSATGGAVEADAFIRAPFDQRITSATRFWDTSGFSFNLGPSGVSLNVNSLAALVEGGISFDTLVSGGAPVADRHVFDVYQDEASARQSVFDDPGDEPMRLAIVFDGSVNGLTLGADVRLRGIKVGELVEMGTRIVNRDNRPEVALLAVVELHPARLGAPPKASEDEVLDLIADLVANGLRARLNTASLLASNLVIDLDEIDDAAPAELNRTADPYPILPSVPANISDFTATAEGVFERINALPIEETLQSAIDLMKSLDGLANDPSLRAAPERALALIDDARAFVGSEDMAELPKTLRAAAEDVRALTEELKQGEAVGRLLGAIDKADAALASLDTASKDLPAITAEVKALAEKANSLAVEDLVASASALVKTVDGYLGTEDAAKLPASLSKALDEVAVFLAEVREGGAIANANGALSAAEEAARSVQAAADSLPDLANRLDGLVRDAQGAVNAYGAKSRLNGEMLAALRDIREAADAFAALARTIQRNPNSLIMGR